MKKKSGLIRDKDNRDRSCSTGGRGVQKRGCNLSSTVSTVSSLLSRSHWVSRTPAESTQFADAPCVRVQRLHTEKLDMVVRLLAASSSVPILWSLPRTLSFSGSFSFESCRLVLFGVHKNFSSHHIIYGKQSKWKEPRNLNVVVFGLWICEGTSPIFTFALKNFTNC